MTEDDTSPSWKEDRLNELRTKVSKAVAYHINNDNNALTHAEMGLGKTYTAGLISKWTAGREITVYTTLWDTREQIKQYAIEYGGLDESDIKLLPTLDRHCECFKTRGEGDEAVPVYPEVYEKLSQVRDQGATASVLHENEKNLPCQVDGRCDYTRRSDFEAKDYQLIIGHPSHAYVDSYNEYRWVLVDEDAAEAFETKLDATEVSRSVNYYLDWDDELDVDNKTELLNLSLTDKIDVLKHVESGDMYDPELAINTSGGRADSRAIIRALLDHDMLPNSGFERATFTDKDGGMITAVRDIAEDESMTIRRPPLFTDRNGIVALDGTPHHEMWENRLGTDLEYDKVLSDAEQREYVSDVLDYTVYQTATTMNPYSSGDHVQENQVYALLEAIADKYDQPIPLVTSKRARSKLRHHKPDVYDQLVADDRLYFNNLRSHSEYENYGLLLVAGCKHSGDREIQRLAALDGYDIGERSGRGTDTDFGELGNSYFEYVCHNETAQAIFRVARGDEAEQADIYVHTAMLPDWIPVEDTLDSQIRYRTPKEHLTIKALQDGGMAPTARLAEKTELGERQTRRQLNNLAVEGYVEKRTHRGRTMWIDEALDDVLWWGEVDLPT